MIRMNDADDLETKWHLKLACSTLIVTLMSPSVTRRFIHFPTDMSEMLQNEKVTFLLRPELLNFGPKYNIKMMIIKTSATSLYILA